SDAVGFASSGIESRGSQTTGPQTSAVWTIWEHVSLESSFNRTFMTRVATVSVSLSRAQQSLVSNPRGRRENTAINPTAEPACTIGATIRERIPNRRQLSRLT